MKRKIESIVPASAPRRSRSTTSRSGASPTTTLRGLTWDHTRGHVPLVATAQRFHELHPDVEVVWEKRTLKAFEEVPLSEMASRYDLIVLDHPFVGDAAADRWLLPLDEHLPAEFLADQAGHSVGASHASYEFGGHHWALAVDAATPVAFWREDLLAERGMKVPRDWKETKALAREGAVEVPAAPINCLMNFYSLCVALGEAPFLKPGRVVSQEVGRAAIAELRSLLNLCDPSGWQRNPIGSHDRVAAADNAQLVYCPLAYGYSNYAREGYAAHRLTFGEPPMFAGSPFHSTLGGTGLAISALRPQGRAAALAYAEFSASPEVQRTLYARSGGQPGHRSAWLDVENNRISGDYFARTLPALDRAFLRPRGAGQPKFQEHAGPLLHAALRGTMNDRAALAQIGAAYRAL